MFKEAKVFCLGLRIEIEGEKALRYHVEPNSYCNLYHGSELLIFDLRERFTSSKSVAFTENSFPEGGM